MKCLNTRFLSSSGVVLHYKSQRDISVQLIKVNFHKVYVIYSMGVLNVYKLFLYNDRRVSLEGYEGKISSDVLCDL